MFSKKQQIAFESYKNGKNIFITGPGGCGKSYLIQQIYKDAIHNKKTIHVTALTGCAAVLLQCDATTIHSWGNIGIANDDYDKILNKIILYKKKDNWIKTQILVIDEISMMSQYLFEMLDYIAKKLRRNNSPFGGIQLICSGDFYQLPPVAFNVNDIKKRNFCFESPIWKLTFDKTLIFDKNYRQYKDKEYETILTEIRNNNLSIDNIERLLDRTKTNIENDEVMYPTILFPLKKMTDDYNSKQFKSIIKDNPTIEIKSFKPKIHKYNKITKKYDKLDDNKKTETIKNKCLKSCMLDDEIKLCVGSKVMIITNIDFENEIINGSQGIIIKFIDNLPLVKFKHCERIIEPMSMKTSDDLYMIEQVPLILSWALTIHKAQGISLDSARINLGSSVFEYGQTYVALSRVKTLNGLYLDSIDFKKIKTNPKVIKFYKTIKT